MIDQEASKALKRLPDYIRQRVARAIDGLRSKPRPANTKALSDELEGYWRLSIDNYRVIYTIDDANLVVKVVRVDKRGPKNYVGLH